MLKESVHDALEFGNLYIENLVINLRAFDMAFTDMLTYLFLISIIARAITHEGSIFRYHWIVY